MRIIYVEPVNPQGHTITNTAILHMRVIVARKCMIGVGFLGCKRELLSAEYISSLLWRCDSKRYRRASKNGWKVGRFGSRLQKFRFINRLKKGESWVRRFWLADLPFQVKPLKFDRSNLYTTLTR